MNRSRKCWCCGVHVGADHLYCIACDGANCNGQYPPCQVEK